jgi:hypothetical protein
MSTAVAYTPENAIQLIKWRFETVATIATERIECRAWLVLMPRRCGKTELLQDFAHVFNRSHHVVVLVSTERVRQRCFTMYEAYREEETMFSPNSVLLVDDYEHCAGSLEAIQAAIDAGSLVVATSSNTAQRPVQFATVLEYTE